MSKSKKGGQWEREICRTLSEWMSSGKATDLFWRSSMSGGRATVRSRKGQTTTGHYGDVAATCKHGNILTSFLAIELKRGYGKGSDSAMPHVLLDRPNGCGQQLFEKWIQQAEDARRLSGAAGWLLAYRRDKRESVVFTERRIEKALLGAGAFKFKPFSRVTIDTMIRFQKMKADNKTIERVWYPKYRLVGMGFEDFLSLVPPEVIRKLSKEHRLR